MTASELCADDRPETIAAALARVLRAAQRSNGRESVLHLDEAALTTKVIGICLNTYDMDENAAREAIARASEETGLPATDPVRFESAALVDAIIGARATI